MKKFLLLFLTPIAAILAQNLQISGGNNFSAAVCDNQIVQVWGANTSGQLANDTLVGTSAIPDSYRGKSQKVKYGNVSNTASVVIDLLPTIKQVDAGSGAHLLGLSCAMQVWAWGENNQGQLGRGASATPATFIPSRVLKGNQDIAKNSATYDPINLYLDSIVYISGGNESSFAVEAGTGYVLAWGNNNFGQLGDGTIVDKTTPVYVLTETGARLSNIVSLEGGDICTYALDAAGNVWSWGVTHDGSFPALNLGRTPVGANIIIAGPGGTSRCAPRAGRVVRTTNILSPHGNCGVAPLANIVQISGGDTHCLAMDGNGNVWSFGGDWGEGQLGKGDAADYNTTCATRVVSPGVVKAANWVEADFMGSGVDGKAIYIAAGQASSAVVFANGKVATFGARGLYNSNATPVGGGALDISCPAGGNIILSGTLGDNSATACNSTQCTGKNTAGTQSHTPVYVAGIPASERITQISDGDAWYFAISASGKVYTWGWNRRGELGLGQNDYVDRCRATELTLSSCTLGSPCPDKPSLGADSIVVCPLNVSQILRSNITHYSTFDYKWYYNTALGPALNLWTPVGTNSNTYTATQIGYYILEVDDNRGLVGAACGPCPLQYDTIWIKEIKNPYKYTVCSDVSGTGGKVKFTVTTPTNSKIKWYTTATGLGVSSTGTGTGPLNPSDSLNTIIVDRSILSTSAACGGDKTIYAEDVDSDKGTLLPGETVADAMSSTGSSVGQGPNATPGNTRATQITITKEITIESVSIIVPNNITSKSYSIVLFNNSLTGNNIGTNRKTFSAQTFTTGNSSQVMTFTLNETLPVGKYWISAITQGGDIGQFDTDKGVNLTTGLFTTAISDQFTKAGHSYVKATTGIQNGSNAKLGPVFNMKFHTGTGYTCGRIALCEDVANTCPLPVSYIYFNASKLGNSVNLTWATAHEDETKAFAIYRSFDGSNFVKVGLKPAKLNGLSYNDYEYTDLLEKTSASNAYYKVVEIHTSGSNANVSRIAAVSLGEHNSSVSIAPNPNAGSFKIALEDEAEHIAVEVFDLTGRLVYNQSGTSNVVNVNLGATAKGVYLVYVSNGADKWVEKVVVE